MQTLSKSSTGEVLNRLLILHQRSLPMFMTYAALWHSKQSGHAVQTLQHLVEDQKRLAGKISEYLQEMRWRIDPGEFPLEYTGLHDLSLTFLWPKLIDAQRGDVAEIEKCVASLANDPFARAIAEEALGAARGHLQTMEEVAPEITEKRY